MCHSRLRRAQPRFICNDAAMPRSTPLLAGAVVASVLIAACSGDDGGAATTAATPAATAVPSTEPAPTTTVAPTTIVATTTTATPTTTAAPAASADDATAYAERGPSPVGVTTLALPNGTAVEVWYPAVDGTTGTETYDVRDFVPEAIRALLTDGSDATFTIDATRDADAADGTFPIVAFSHGFTGMRLQSCFLTSHLASYGMIVVAPDHPSRDLANVLGGTGTGDREAPIAELLGSIDLIIAEGDRADGPFAGRVDAERVALIGHSAGGGTVLAAALDDRVDAYVSMAAGGPVDDAAFPGVPSLFLAGETDGIVSPTDRTRPAFEAAPSPTWYWELADTGHNGFDDFCAFGGGTGIIGVADQSGLGPLLDAQPQLRTLGEDGCIPPAAPVEQAWPIIRHGVTSWLRWQLGLDAEPVGFGPEVADAFELPVTVVER